MNRPATSLIAVLALVCGCSGPPEPPDRSKPPALGAAPELKLPAIQKAALSNGVPVVLVESHEVPLVQVNLLIRSGSGDDPSGKFGLASLTMAMLDEGAGSRNALQISDDVEYLGATLGTTSSFDASAVRLNVPVARLADALPLMADVALRPTFPQTDLDRLGKSASPRCSRTGTTPKRWRRRHSRDCSMEQRIATERPRSGPRQLSRG